MKNPKDTETEEIEMNLKHLLWWFKTHTHNKKQEPNYTKLINDFWFKFMVWSIKMQIIVRNSQISMGLTIRT